MMEEKEFKIINYIGVVGTFIIVWIICIAFSGLASCCFMYIAFKISLNLDGHAVFVGAISGSISALIAFNVVRGVYLDKLN